MWQNHFLIVLSVIIALLEAARGDRDTCDTLYPGIPRCELNDEKCHANMFNLIIQNELPGYNLPDLCPYRPYQNWTLATCGTGPLSLIYFNGTGSNIRIDGLRNVNVLTVRGLKPGTTCIEADLTIPWLVFDCCFDVVARALLVVPFQAKGDLTATVTNVKIHLSIKCEVVERNGKQYVKVICITSTFDCDGFHADFNFHSPVPLEKELVDTIMNTFWKWYKGNLAPYLRKYASTIDAQFMNGIMGKLSIDKFFRCSCID